jgi:hypothetical protein
VCFAFAAFGIRPRAAGDLSSIHGASRRMLEDRVGACRWTFSRKIRGRVRSCAKSLARVLHDLIQPEAVDVRHDLTSNRQVAGHWRCGGKRIVCARNCVMTIHWTVRVRSLLSTFVADLVSIKTDREGEPSGRLMKAPAIGVSAVFSSTVNCVPVLSTRCW